MLKHEGSELVTSFFDPLGIDIGHFRGGKQQEKTFCDSLVGARKAAAMADAFYLKKVRDK